ncbi:hypothetical protein F4703DRAFT_1939026, partial [Phycomyces blakesleeanus]
FLLIVHISIYLYIYIQADIKRVIIVAVTVAIWSYILFNNQGQYGITSQLGS